MPRPLPMGEGHPYGASWAWNLVPSALAPLHKIINMPLLRNTSSISV